METLAKEVAKLLADHGLPVDLRANWIDSLSFLHDDVFPREHPQGTLNVICDILNENGYQCTIMVIDMLGYIYFDVRDIVRCGAGEAASTIEDPDGMIASYVAPPPRNW